LDRLRRPSRGGLFFAVLADGVAPRYHAGDRTRFNDRNRF
jgi:hypothetical protein